MHKEGRKTNLEKGYYTGNRKTINKQLQIQEVSKPKRNFSYVHTFLFVNQETTGQ